MTFTFPYAATVVDLFFSSDPESSIGVLLSPDDPFGLLFSVHVCSPYDVNDKAWGVAQWGSTPWGLAGAGRWIDVSDRVRGLSWSRGSDEPGGRPRVGTAAATFANTDGEVSPWATSGPFVNGSSWIHAGMYVRFGVRRSAADVPDGASGGWWPFFAGIVDTLEEGTEENADGWLTVNLVESLSYLASFQNLARVTPVFAGEGLDDFIQSITDDAKWPFGLDTSLSPDADAGTFQGTTLEGPRIDEVYKVGDSCGARILSSSTGALAITVQKSGTTLDALQSGTSRGTFSNDPGPSDLPIEVDAVVPYASTERVINVVTAARAGGTAQTVRDERSIGQYGEVTSGYGFPRDDLVGNEDSVVLAVLREVLTDHSFDELGIASIDVDADMDPSLWIHLAALCSFGLEARVAFTVRWTHPSGNVFEIPLVLDSFEFGLTMEGSQAKWTGTLSTSKA